MSFGTKASKDNTPKSNKSQKPDYNEIARENLIIERIAYYTENSDAGCIGLKHISEKMSGVKEIEIYVKKCVEKYNYILHNGWIYGKLWNIHDVNSISNENVSLLNFDVQNGEHNRQLLERISKGGLDSTYLVLESLCLRGVLKMNKKEMDESLQRLFDNAKIYEPRIGTYVAVSK